jgi:hypothetical protein
MQIPNGSYELKLLNLLLCWTNTLNWADAIQCLACYCYLVRAASVHQPVYISDIINGIALLGAPLAVLGIDVWLAVSVLMSVLVISSGCCWGILSTTLYLGCVLTNKTREKLFALERNQMAWDDQRRRLNDCQKTGRACHCKHAIYDI